MNKLISKNPVQRFKQGRKLIKAQFGWKVREDGVVVNRFGVPVRANDAGYRPYSMTQDVSYQKEYPNDKQIAPGLYVEPETNDVYASRKDGNNGEASARLISEGFGIPANGTYYESTDTTGKVVDRGRYFGGKKHSLPIGGTKNRQQKRAYYQFDPTDGSKYLIGTDGSKTLVSKGNKSNNSSKTRVNNKKNNSARQRNPGAYHNITTWQNKLKDFYEPGTFAVDGIWGKNTEAAYQKYLQSQKTPNEIKEEAWRNAPQSQARNVYNQALNIAAPKVLQALNNKQIAEDANVPYEIRVKAAMGAFKNGGILPSRNVVTRFKNRKFN